MASQEVKLIGFWVSPFVLRVELALRLKGVEYEYIEDDVIANKSPLLLEMNPIHKKVPVLVHNGKPIAESFIILEYIDETWKQNPLLPQHPYDKAIARFWAKFSEEKLLEAAYKALLFNGDEQKKDVEASVEALEKIEEQIQGKKFFGGETIGYLDLALGWISYMLPAWEEIISITIMEPSKFPAIASWKNNFVNHPMVKDKLPPRDKMVAYFTERRKTIGAAKYH